MDLKLLPTVICRTPLFSYEDTLDDKWDELKEAIKIASKDLYEQIKDTKKEDYDTLPEKVRFSCWKYFNRARFRATPFGPFGSITMVPLDKAGSNVILETEPTLHRFTNWIHKDTLLTDPIALYKNAKLFQANTSVYPCGDQLRYISMLEDGTFEIASIDKQAIIEDVLHKCKTTITKEEVVEHLVHAYTLDLAVVTDFLIQLITLQLLLTDLHPNIIGTDYFKRVGLHSKAFEQDPYIIATRPLLKGSFNIQSFKVIPEAINFIKDYLPQPVHKPLEDFKRAFQLKFEYREVPLLEALDPEIGVGYNELESSPRKDELAEFLKNNIASPSKSRSIHYTPLIEHLLSAISIGKSISLETLKIPKLENNKTPSPIPNVFNGLVAIVDQHIIAEQLGGITGNALLGRFTPGNPPVLSHCRNISVIEHRTNPGTIFFDIAYQAEKEVDNVNRRSSIYDYELSISSWSESKCPIHLSDILVSVQFNEIVLRSKEHNKRLVPRLSTAYNYRRSDLAVFRFLCDLQHYNLLTNFSINLREVFPNLDHYPRLSYKNLILSPQAWRIPNQIRKDSIAIFCADLKNWLYQHHISRYFRVDFSDQFLWFDSNNTEDLSVLLSLFKKNKSVYITEMFLPEKAQIRNVQHKPYLEQFILTLYHGSAIYRQLKEEKREVIKSNIGTILPGQDWVYFEIYSHEARSNTILSLLSSFLKEKESEIKSWFFIRYPIPTNHIRFRIQLKDHMLFQNTVFTLTKYLEKDINSGLISDFSIKPYRRELERYGLTTIEKVEYCFFIDSEYTLKIIALMLSDSEIYLLVIRLLNTLLSNLKISHQLKAEYISQTAVAFAKETAINSQGFKQINQTYESIKNRSVVLPTNLLADYQRMLSTITAVLVELNESECLKLIGDLIHMHVNRLFTADQRIHELIIYQLYLKQLVAEKKYLKRST